MSATSRRLDQANALRSHVTSVAAFRRGSFPAREEKWNRLTKAEIEREIVLCAASPSYFINRYVSIFDADTTDWIPFRLWAAQETFLDIMQFNQLSIGLKARQVGFTWEVLAFFQWRSLFRPKRVILLFSRRDDEAIVLLSDERFRGILKRLPEWMQPRIIVDNAHQLTLANGSVIYAFPTQGGDSYTATDVLIDEADLIPDLNGLLASVKPTIDSGGNMVMISRVDKSKPESPFKKTYLAAKDGKNKFAPYFVPWYVRPGRTQAWYADVRAEIVARTGSTDELDEQYPATDIDALKPRSKDKRIHPDWVANCRVELLPYPEEELPADAPAIPQLVVFQLPQKRRKYVQGADPAEGNPISDDSALTVLDADTGEEVASLAGKFEPSTLAAHIDRIGIWYNNAAAMVERNNHGHAVLLWLKDNSRIKRLEGHDGKEGWLSNSKGKALLYDTGADAFRDQETIVHTNETYFQIMSIEGSTLRAPDQQLDDRADSYVLALSGIEALRKQQPPPPRVW